MGNQLVKSGQFTTCALLLRMAKSFHARGQLNQAIDAYTRILMHYPNSPEASEALGKLLALAQAYEQQGQYHLALGLHEKLERLS